MLFFFKSAKKSRKQTDNAGLTPSQIKYWREKLGLNKKPLKKKKAQKAKIERVVNKIVSKIAKAPNYNELANQLILKNKQTELDILQILINQKLLDAQILSVEQRLQQVADEIARDAELQVLIQQLNRIEEEAFLQALAKKIQQQKEDEELLIILLLED